MEDRRGLKWDLHRIGAAVVGALLLVGAPILWLVLVILSEEGWDTNEPLRISGTVIAVMLLIAGLFAFPYGGSRGLGRVFWALLGLSALLLIAWFVAHDACSSCGTP